MNGAFKIEFYKAKREYLKDKDDNEKKFYPTDVVPLVNTAWEKSFARSDQTKKAVMERGWSPLNYVLLDHPKVKKNDDAINLTNVSTDEIIDATTTDESPDLTTDADSSNLTTLQINCSGKATKKYVEKLLNNQEKAVGRTKAYQDRLQK